MTVGHDDVVAEDAFGVCAELGDRGFGVLVAVVRRKHHADRAELFDEVVIQVEPISSP